MTKNIVGSQESLMKDNVNEAAFLKVLKGDTTFSTELEMLGKIYSEQLEALMRLRIDTEIHDYLILAEPEQRNHLDDKAKTTKSLITKRKLVNIIREHIVYIKEMENQNGKTD